MAVGANVFGIGLSGLRAAQVGLATTSHNIANAGTPGYSRQRLDLAAGVPLFDSGSYFGSGVRLLEVRRSYDQFLTHELRSETALAAEQRLHHTLAAGLDALLSDPATGLAASLQGYFDALQEAAADPASGTARQLLLDQVDGLAGRFRDLDGGLRRAHDAVEAEARGAVESINALAAEVARLNRGIAQARGQGAVPNDLLDQRDELVRQLSAQVGVTTLMQDDGSLNVYIGTGQTLVVGSESYRLTLAPRGVDRPMVGVLLEGGGGGQVEVTSQVRGGALGAAIAFEGGLLSDAERRLGQIALGLADAMNAQHRLGMDQNGRIGGDLFTAVNDPTLTSARALAQASNSGDARLDVTIDSLADLGDSDYLLSYDGSAYQLVRMSDKALIGTFASLPQGLGSEGFSIALAGGSPAPGDSFIVRPTAGAAQQMRRVVPDGASLALASPVRAAAAADNLGDASIGALAVGGLTGSPLANAVNLTYDESVGGFLVGTPPGGILAYDPAADTGSNLALTVPGFGELRFVVNGTPENGDLLTIESNLLGTGDNKNVLALAGVPGSPLLLGGTASLAQAYELTVGEIASRTRGLSLSADTQERLLQRAQESREALSGVNLDEEAAALLRYQQAYEASARVIAASDELFQTLLNALGG